MLFRASLLLLLGLSNGVQAQLDDPQKCAANPECAHLADNCCPTNQAGIFLDCCENKVASCSSNPGCSGLVDDCCPAADGTFLYCCFENPSGGYLHDFTYYGRHAGEQNVGAFYASTGALQYFHGQTMVYTRNADLVYDLIYLKGGIPDAGAYITGEKKFSLQLGSTTAPPCTQIILQFEHIDFADPTSLARQAGTTFEPYPKNRHSRYLATVPKDPQQQRIEFDFIDRPDDTVADADVNAVVLLFAPGVKEDYSFSFHNLDSNSKCEGGESCKPSPVLSCPAIYMTVEGEASTRSRVLQSEPDCSDCANPACIGVDACAIDSANNALNFEVEVVDDETATESTVEGDGEPAIETTTQNDGDATDSTTQNDGDTATVSPATNETTGATVEVSGARSAIGFAVAGMSTLVFSLFGF